MHISTAYLVLTYVNSYEVWREECRRNMTLEEEEEEPQLMQGPAAKKKWTAEGRG
jgi:hypothetical protein